MEPWPSGIYIYIHIYRHCRLSSILSSISLDYLVERIPGQMHYIYVPMVRDYSQMTAYSRFFAQCPPQLSLSWIRRPNNLLHLLRQLRLETIYQPNWLQMYMARSLFVYSNVFFLEERGENIDSALSRLYHQRWLTGSEKFSGHQCRWIQPSQFLRQVRLSRYISLIGQRFVWPIRSQTDKSKSQFHISQQMPPERILDTTVQISIEMFCSQPLYPRQEGLHAKVSSRAMRMKTYIEFNFLFNYGYGLLSCL